MKTLASILGGMAIVYLILVVFFSNYERRVLYHPSQEVFTDITSFGTENHYLSSSIGDQIHVIYKEQRRDNVILFCHGNAGNITANIGNLEALEATGYSYLMFDYPGYGQSTGSPSEASLYAAGQAAYDFLIQEKGFNSDQIILDGQSLGGAVAIELASKNPARSLIVASSFTSIHGMAHVLLPSIPAQLFTSQKFDNLSKISQVNIPVLFLHGEHDQTVPAEQSKLLYEAAHEPKYLILIPDIDHDLNAIQQPGEHEKAISQFIEKAFIPESFHTESP